MTIIYISGPIWSEPRKTKPAFNLEAYRLNDRGDSVLNPAMLPDGLTQEQYLSICTPMVIAADEIRMLSGWENSSIAIAEHSLALALRKIISYQDE